MSRIWWCFGRDFGCDLAGLGIELADSLVWESICFGSCHVGVSQIEGFWAMGLVGLLGLSHHAFRSIGGYGHETFTPAYSQPWWWIWAVISVFLVLFAGIMSGLTLGLMSLGLMDLEVLQQSGTDAEKKQATKIMPVVRKQHQLLVTLLLCNAAAMEALPIFLDDMFNEVVAVLLSVTFVLTFGEVIPQAICSRHGLAIGADMIWLVRFLMALCWPIAYPVGKILDRILGHNDSALFRRAQLKALVLIHGREAGRGGELTREETTIIQGALDLTAKTALDSMTPIESTFSLDINSKLDWEAMGKIMARGHSRVPVYEGNSRNLIGVLLVKSLLTVRAEAETPVSAVSIRRIPRVSSDMPLYDILNEFQKGGSHMAAVTKAKGKRKSGICTVDGNEKPNGFHAHEKLESWDKLDLEKGVGDPYFFDAIKDEKESKGVGDPYYFDASKDEKENKGAEDPYYFDARKDNNGTKGVGDSYYFDASKDEKESKGYEESTYGKEEYGGVYNYCSDGEVIGIITMEDVMEELLQEEIVDETDVYIDVHKKVRVASAAAHVRAGSMLIRRVANPQLGLSKQGQQAVKKIRQVEKEARVEHLATHGHHGDVTLTVPLLSKCEGDEGEDEGGKQ